jgi:hypothetical protein
LENEGGDEKIILKNKFLRSNARRCKLNVLYSEYGCYATSQKVADSSRDEVVDHFLIYPILLPATRP